VGFTPRVGSIPTFGTAPLVGQAGVLRGSQKTLRRVRFSTPALACRSEWLSVFSQRSDRVVPDRVERWRNIGAAGGRNGVFCRPSEREGQLEIRPVAMMARIMIAHRRTAPSNSHPNPNGINAQKTAKMQAGGSLAVAARDAPAPCSHIRPTPRQASSATASGAPVHRAGHPGHSVPRYRPKSIASATATRNRIV
jgi:hypothetical protein